MLGVAWESCPYFRWTSPAATQAQTQGYDTAGPIIHSIYDLLEHVKGQTCTPKAAGSPQQRATSGYSGGAQVSTQQQQSSRTKDLKPDQ